MSVHDDLFEATAPLSELGADPKQVFRSLLFQGDTWAYAGVGKKIVSETCTEFEGSKKRQMGFRQRRF